MKVLFDHNVPEKLRHFQPLHSVSTAREMGWAVLENGTLLREAELGGFDIMVTCDQNLSYQQNLQNRTLALVILSTNNWNLLKINPEPIASALDAAHPGSFLHLKIQTGAQRPWGPTRGPQQS